MTVETKAAQPPRRLIPVEEAGPYLTPGATRPLSRSSIYRLIKDGKLHKVNIGKRSFVTVASIEDYVARLIEGGCSKAEGDA